MEESVMSMVFDAIGFEVREMMYANDKVNLHISAIQAMRNLNRLLNLKCEQIEKGADHENTERH